MNSEVPRPSPVTGERSVELLGEERVGLQARLLVGDFSNPQLVITKKKLRSIEEGGALGIAEKTASMYQTASLTQRRRHQQETGLTYARWLEGMNTYLGNIRGDQEHSERKEFLETIGITENVHATDFYNEFLREKSDIIKFVDTIETLASREQIQNNEDIIRQLGNAFGYESSEVIDHLIHGVKNIKEDSSSFVNQARQQVNTPDVLNNSLFGIIQRDGVVEEEEKPPIKRAPKKVVPARKPLPPKPPPQPSQFRATRVQRIDFDDEKDRRLPSGGGSVPPEKEENIQVYPAPNTQLERSDMPLAQSELGEVPSLLYNDVFRANPHEQEEDVRRAEIIRYYARELHAMAEEYGQDFILQRAATAVNTLQRYLQELLLKSDKHSKSRSWYLWGIAKSRFLANNPDIQQTLPNAEHYEPFDPLLQYRIGRHSEDWRKSHQVEQGIIDGMLGWEVYRQRKRKDIILRLDPLMHPNDKKRLRTLIVQPPKQHVPTLSSYQLREIGRLVRENKFHQ